MLYAKKLSLTKRSLCLIISLMVVMGMFFTIGTTKSFADVYYNYTEFMTPFWSTTTMYEESVLMISGNGGLPEASLLFTPVDIISVKNAALDYTYTEGVDWVYENGKLKLLAGSSAPYLTTSQLYPDPPTPGWYQLKVGGGYVLFQEGHYFHSLQLSVTYTHAANAWSGPIPQFNSSNLPNSLNKLRNGNAFKIVLYGDSISCGSSATGIPSGGSITSPYMSIWGDLFVYNLQKYYSSPITFINSSVGGMDSEWGLSNASSLVTSYNPDLVIIAFGMNDGTEGVSPATFKNNIQGIMNNVRAQNPNAEFVLVATMLANPETYFAGQQANYLAQLQTLAGTGTVIMNMTGVHQELLNHKSYYDMTGNGVNHPNDFLIRWYAQYISGLFIDPDAQIKDGGFESPSTSSYIYRPTGSNWSYVYNGGVQHNGSAFGAYDAPEGVQTGFLQGYGSGSSTISQTVNITTGGAYCVLFSTAKRLGYGDQTFKVYFDSTDIGTFTPSSGSFQEAATNSFTTTAGNHTIMFSGQATTDCTAFIDKVRLGIPKTIFTTQTPASDTSWYQCELGTKFRVLIPGEITKVRFYASSTESGTHTARIWRVYDGALIAGPYTFNVASGGGWKEYALAAPVGIDSNMDYIISIQTGSDGRYAYTLNGFDNPINNGNLVTYTGSGCYTTTLGSMPTSVYSNTDYFRDVVFVPN